MNEILNERLEQVINLIPQYSWSLMTEEQKDDLMSGIVLPRYMATTSDGTKLTPSTWGAILGASPAAVKNRVQRLKASQKSKGETVSPTQRDKDIRAAKRVARDSEAIDTFVESLPLESRVDLAKSLAASTKSTPISEKRQKDSEAANAPLDRAINSFAAQLGTVSLIDRATDEINKAVAGNGLGPSALQQIEAAVDRLNAALDFAKSMAGEVSE